MVKFSVNKTQFRMSAESGNFVQQIINSGNKKGLILHESLDKAATAKSTIDLV